MDEESIEEFCELLADNYYYYLHPEDVPLFKPAEGVADGKAGFFRDGRGEWMDLNIEVIPHQSKMSVRLIESYLP